MLKNKIEKALYNPAIGLIPILLVVFLLIYQPINQAVDAALSTLVIGWRSSAISYPNTLLVGV